RRRLDVRLVEPRGARAHDRRGSHGLLEPLATGALAQGRHVRPCPALGGAPRGLRRRRAPRPCPPGGRRVPHGRPFVLLPRAQLTNDPAGTCCVMQCGPPPPWEIQAPGTPTTSRSG